MIWYIPSSDAWKRVRFLRCPVCAAALLNEDDASLHAAWHDRMEMPKQQGSLTPKAESERLFDVMMNGELSLRAYNGITGKWKWDASGCFTVYDLTKFTQQDLMCGKNFGIKSLAEVAAVLKKRGLSFKEGGPDFLRIEVGKMRKLGNWDVV